MAENGSDRTAKAREARAANRAAARQATTPLDREHVRVDAAVNDNDLREAQRIRIEQHGNRPSIGDTTGTHTTVAAKGKGQQYVVLHGAVGQHPRGAVVYENHFGANVDIKRLLDLEAIAKHDEAADEDPSDLSGFEDAPLPTLTEAAFSESPPTLPRSDGIDVSDEDVQDAVDQGVGTNEPRPEESQDVNKTQGSS